MQFRPSSGFWRVVGITSLYLTIGCQGDMPSAEDADPASGGNSGNEVASAGAGGSNDQALGGQGGESEEISSTSPQDAALPADPPPDAGTNPMQALDTAAPTNPNLKPAIIGGGYGALRLVSFDGGLTWKNRVVNNPNGGDDTNLIRAINYADGLWVAVGWKIFLSEDGVKWTEIPDQTVPGGWYDCATYQDGMHIVKTIRADRGGQNGPAIFSRDRGKTWQTANFTTRCTPPAQPFPNETARVRSEWKGKISRSTNGTSWQTVHTDCCSISMFAKGMAAEN